MRGSLQAKRAEYERHYKGGYARVGKGGRVVVVPEDVAMIEGDGAPCFMCGIARGPCRHRVPA